MSYNPFVPEEGQLPGMTKEKPRRAGSIARQGDKDAARRVVEQRFPHRPAPPARAERGFLLVPDHDQVAFQLRREAADLLHRLADRQMAGDAEALLPELL